MHSTSLITWSLLLCSYVTATALSYNNSVLENRQVQKSANRASASSAFSGTETIAYGADATGIDHTLTSPKHAHKYDVMMRSITCFVPIDNEPSRPGPTSPVLDTTLLLVNRILNVPLVQLGFLIENFRIQNQEVWLQRIFLLALLQKLLKDILTDLEPAIRRGLQKSDPSAQVDTQAGIFPASPSSTSSQICTATPIRCNEAIWSNDTQHDSKMSTSSTPFTDNVWSNITQSYLHTSTTTGASTISTSRTENASPNSIQTYYEDPTASAETGPSTSFVTQEATVSVHVDDVGPSSKHLPPEKTLPSPHSTDTAYTKAASPTAEAVYDLRNF